MADALATKLAATKIKYACSLNMPINANTITVIMLLQKTGKLV